MTERANFPSISGRGSGRILTRMALTLSVLAMLTAALLPSAASAGVNDTVHYNNKPIAAWRANGVGYATLIVGDTVYVGGDFTTVTSPDGKTVLPRSNLAAFSATTGALISTFTADTNGGVRSLASDGTRLYVGGLFSTVNTSARSHLAAVNLATGAVDSKWVANANGIVYALSIGGGNLYVGGTFGVLKSVARTKAGAVRLSDDALQPYAPSLNNTVVSIAATADASRVYLSGQFTVVNGRRVLDLVTTAGTTGATTTPSLPSTGAPTDKLSLSADGAYLAVALDGGNQSILYDARTGRARWTQRCGGNGQAVKIIDGSVFSGFHDSCDRNSLLRLTSNQLINGRRDTAFAPTFNKFYGVRSIDGNEKVLVIAGDFTWISTVAAEGFAIFPISSISPPR